MLQNEQYLVLWRSRCCVLSDGVFDDFSGDDDDDDDVHDDDEHDAFDDESDDDIFAHFT